jgi:hypothetical protein
VFAKKQKAQTNIMRYEDTFTGVKLLQTFLKNKIATFPNCSCDVSAPQNMNYICNYCRNIPNNLKDEEKKDKFGSLFE